jgi:hypothetical protein
MDENRLTIWMEPAAVKRNDFSWGAFNSVREKIRAIRNEMPRSPYTMRFDPQAIFANLAEKERIKGHHSPEGRAIRTLTRALHGWSTSNLSPADVLVLCDQAIEDWLKARLKVSPWSAPDLPKLMTTALNNELITRLEAVRLQRIHNARSRLRDDGAVSAPTVESALETCIQVVEKHW